MEKLVNRIAILGQHQKKFLVVIYEFAEEVGDPGPTTVHVLSLVEPGPKLKFVNALVGPSADQVAEGVIEEKLIAMKEHVQEVGVVGYL